MTRFLAFITLMLILTCPAIVKASDNNIFGIHVATLDESRLGDISTLVNSSFGDWGYITFVIQETDRDTGKWSATFDTLQDRRLIPIVRIATRAEGENWRRPSKEDAGQWVTFLDALPWPTEQRYVVLFNEPNHGSEWGGSVNPEHYAEVAEQFARDLTNEDPRFVVMLAGLDGAAPSNNPRYEDETTFLDRVMGVFTPAEMNQFLGGWASHSYPNPGFVGSPTASGRATIRHYAWELAYLKSKGVKDLPVFVTETGWPHRETGTGINAAYRSKEQVAEYLRVAFEEVWFKDSRIRAVTPFVFDYPVSPFAEWSWRLPDGSGYYPQYDTVRAIRKIPGNPSGTGSDPVPVYRFGSRAYGKHFYTASSAERDAVITSYPNTLWKYEGPNYRVFTRDAAGTVAVHRFTSKEYKGHFYTASEAERQHVESTYPDDVWKYEGIAFRVYPPESNEPGTVTVHRFTSAKYRGHFYTASEEERAYVDEAYSDDVWKYEGVAWKAPAY